MTFTTELSNGSRVFDPALRTSHVTDHASLKTPRDDPRINKMAEDLISANFADLELLGHVTEQIYSLSAHQYPQLYRQILKREPANGANLARLGGVNHRLEATERKKLESALFAKVRQLAESEIAVFAESLAQQLKTIASSTDASATEVTTSLKATTSRLTHLLTRLTDSKRAISAFEALHSLRAKLDLQTVENERHQTLDPRLHRAVLASAEQDASVLAALGGMHHLLSAEHRLEIEPELFGRVHELPETEQARFSISLAHQLRDLSAHGKGAQVAGALRVTTAHLLNMIPVFRHAQHAINLIRELHPLTVALDGHTIAAQRRPYLQSRLYDRVFRSRAIGALFSAETRYGHGLSSPNRALLLSAHQRGIAEASPRGRAELALETKHRLQEEQIENFTGKEAMLRKKFITSVRERESTLDGAQRRSRKAANASFLHLFEKKKAASALAEAKASVADSYVKLQQLDEDVRRQDARVRHAEHILSFDKACIEDEDERADIAINAGGLDVNKLAAVRIKEDSNGGARVDIVSQTGLLDVVTIVEALDKHSLQNWSHHRKSTDPPELASLLKDVMS